MRGAQWKDCNLQKAQSEGDQNGQPQARGEGAPSIIRAQWPLVASSLSIPKLVPLSFAFSLCILIQFSLVNLQTLHEWPLANIGLCVGEEGRREIFSHLHQTGPTGGCCKLSCECMCATSSSQLSTQLISSVI